MKKRDIVEIKIDTLSGDGRTVGHYEGCVVFVEGSVPGDVVLARITKLKKNYCDAVTEKIVTFSRLRTEARCKHFGVCGGCRWQNLTYEAQLEYKRQLVVDAFTRIGSFQTPDILDAVPCSDPYWYRNKMEYTFSNYRWLTKDELDTLNTQEQEVALGLHIPGRYYKVLNIDECFLQSEMSPAILRRVRNECRALGLTVYSTKTHTGYLRHLVIRDGKRTGECMVNLVTTYDDEMSMTHLTNVLKKEFPGITTIVNNITDRKSMVAQGESEKIYYGGGSITEKLGDYTFGISANSFFQTNTLQAEKLYSIVKGFAELKNTDVVYDLYCGTGTIAIFLSDAVKQVIGIDIVESASTDAKKNAGLNGISNCFFYKGDLKEKLTRETDWQLKHPPPSVVVLDPPRSGVHPKGLEQVVNLKPDRIVYVSCNPATQARDAKLLASGGYNLIKVQPVDMFPHTDHVEAVALFRH
jgi:23S rRNA (uracil1939-C5)-methyltransferase